VDERIRDLARRSPNFGFLLDHEPLLVLDGTEAEAYVFSDPNAALFKSRRFGETLAAKLVATGRIQVSGSSQHARLAALTRDGVIQGSQRQQFDDLRTLGNRAVHTHYGEVRAALDAVRTCFSLGSWYYRMVTGDRAPTAFVPPPNPATPPSDAADQADLDLLRTQLSSERERLAEVRLRLEGRNSRLEAELLARTEVERMLAQVAADRDELRTLADELSTRVGEFEASFTASLARPARLSAAQREAFIKSAQQAAREPRTEREVRAEVDAMLTSARWIVQDSGKENLFAGTGVAVREAMTATGPADYLLYVDRRLAGVIEAKREGTVLTPVERQSARYAEGLTASQQLQAWRLPLPFRYETTAAETHFTNVLDPHPRAREVFSFHQPTTLARWMREADADSEAPTFRARLRRGLPPLDDGRLRPAQADAVRGLEESLRADRARALIQMATGAGKTFAAVSSCYRLLRNARAERILFLVDRNNLGKQAHTEFTGYVTPDDGRKLAELYGVERLTGANVLASSNVVISTVQRVYAMLCGKPLPDPDTDDPAYDSYDVDDVIEVGYNPVVPPETFDVIIVDECHRSIYGRWRAVLEYFDAYLVGLTATPVKQTFGFFHQNLVSEYTYQQAVADGVNVDFDVYKIRTRQTEQGDTIEAGTVVPRRERRTRRQRYEELDDDFSYAGSQLGRNVISKPQLKLILETFRDRLFSEIFPPGPGQPRRRYVPKTLIYARDDNHAEEIVQMVREVFGMGNEFAQKITYSAQHPDKLLAAFRNSPELRIAVTVDLIATGTDVKPIECVFFLRDVKSWAYFEQMKGRGARTLDPAELNIVTPDVPAKERFVIVDAVGVTDSPRADATPMQLHSERQISLEKLLNKAGNLSISLAETSTLCSRIARLNQDLTPAERDELEQIAGVPLSDVIRSLGRAADDDELAAIRPGDRAAERALVEQAVQPLAASPDLRARLLEIRRAHDITYDEVNPDDLWEARGVDVTERARELVTSWRAYLHEHRDEISTIEAAYRHGDGSRAVYVKLKELAARIARPPHQWSPDLLWHAYQRLEIAAARPGVRYGPVDLIGLIRFELGLDQEPHPHRSVVEERFTAWLARQQQAGAQFSPDQVWWLERIRDIVITSASFTTDDLDGVPFTERGGTDGFLLTFGNDRAQQILTDLNRTLTA
jgi:type I restriction enzyme, R subunit